MFSSRCVRFAARFRQRTAYAHRQLYATRLWQEGFFDRCLRDEDDWLTVARYIVMNPVEDGLCDDVRAYPYVGSSRYSIDELIEIVGLETLG